MNIYDLTIILILPVIRPFIDLYTGECRFGGLPRTSMHWGSSNVPSGLATLSSYILGQIPFHEVFTCFFPIFGRQSITKVIKERKKRHHRARDDFW